MHDAKAGVRSWSLSLATHHPREPKPCARQVLTRLVVAHTALRSIVISILRYDDHLHLLQEASPQHVREASLTIDQGGGEVRAKVLQLSR